MSVILPQSSHPTLGVTYLELEGLIAAEGSNVRRNLAALKAFMVWRQRRSDQLVGEDFGVGFATQLGEFLAYSAKRLSKGAMANRKSALKQLHRLYQRRLTTMSPLAPPFPQALRDAIGALSTRQAQQRYGSVVRRWLASRGRPQAADLAVLQRIEQEAQLPPGTLTRYVDEATVGDRIADFSEHQAPLRARHLALIGTPFIIWLSRAADNPELATLHHGWRQFFDFQTRLHPHPLQRSGGWSRNKRGDYPSADRWLATVGAFFGFLALPPSPNPQLSGLGIPVAKLSFAMLGCFELWRRFIDFRHTRAGGGQHFNSEVVFCLHVVRHLTRPDTGWLAQTEARWLPDLRLSLEASGIRETDRDGGETLLQDSVRPGYFVAQHAKLQTWLHSAPRKIRMTRDPQVRLAPFLAVESPMRRYIFPLIERLAAERQAIPQQDRTRRFYAERRLMLIVAFFTLPLRLLNWQLCQVGPGKPGDNLFRRHDGLFRMHITREEMKNRQYLDDHYSITLSRWAQPFFAHYVDHVLPHLGQQGPAVGGGPWLFTALDGQAMTEQSLRQAFAGAFAQYFNYPLHPHAPRHIVVTDLLKADPRNLPIAAILLNEDIKTVRKSYAHLLTQDVYAHFDDFSSQQASDVLGHTVPLVFEESGLPKGRR